MTSIQIVSHLYHHKMQSVHIRTGAGRIFVDEEKVVEIFWN